VQNSLLPKLFNSKYILISDRIEATDFHSHLLSFGETATRRFCSATQPGCSEASGSVGKAQNSACGSGNFSASHPTAVPNTQAMAQECTLSRVRTDVSFFGLHHEIVEDSNRVLGIKAGYVYANLSSPTKSVFSGALTANGSIHTVENRTHAVPEAFAYTDVLTDYELEHESQRYVLATWSGGGCSM
jgi:hypothetical protein